MINTLRFIYDRQVTGKTGTIKIYDASNNLLKTINSNDSYVYYNTTADNKTKVEADISQLGINWVKNTNYVITVDEGFVEEIGNNKSPSPAQTINYTTPNEPFVESTVPANNATNVTQFTIQLTFDEAVTATSGNFYLYSSPANTLLSTISVTNTRVSINEKTVSIDLTGLVELNTSYHIRADANSLKNGFDFQFLGIANDSVLKFTTSDAVLGFSLNNPDINVEYFGHKVAISNNYIAVATNGDSTNSINGYVYIYDKNGTLLRTIQDPGTRLSKTFEDMKISDNYLAFTSRSGNTPYPWHRVYVYNITNGTLLRTFSPPTTTETEELYGCSLSLDGNNIAIGYPAFSSASLNSRVYVYNISNGSLIRTITKQTQFPTEPDRWFGYSVAISGDNLLIGEVDEGNSENGIAYLYSISSGNLLRTINSPGSTTVFGNIVAISNNYYAIKNNTNLYVYSVSSGSLLQTIAATGTDNIDISGDYISYGGYIIYIPTGKIVKQFIGTIDGVSLTTTNVRSDINGNSVIIGSTNQNKCLFFTIPGI